MSHSLFVRSVVYSTLVVGAILTTPVFGEDTVAEVVVTAQRRSELSRDVPISITSLSADALEQSGVQQLGDIAKLTPALRFDASGSFFQPTIRGVGTAVATSGGGPNVGIYVDGFFSSNSEVSDFQLMKVQSIQVLKGPQGTLFGRNTTGGAILVTTADPSTKPGAELKASYGSFNAVKLQGYGTFGLSEKIAMDVEGIYSRGDSFIRNIVTHDDKQGKYENWSVRTGLKAELTDSVSVLLSYTHAHTDDPSSLLTNAYVDENGQAGFLKKLPTSAYGTNDTTGRALVYFFAPPTAYTTDPDQTATPFHTAFTNKSDTVQARVKADLGFADLTSYTQYRQDRALNLQDLDATALSFFDIRLGIDDTTVSQEFLLNSKPGSRLQWTAGANYFQNRDTWSVDASFGATPFVPFGGSSTKSKSSAGFVDMTYELTPELFLTAGARYSHDVVADAYFYTNFSEPFYEGADGNPVSLAGVPPQTKVPVNDLTSNRFTPRIVLRYKPTQQSSVYGSYTRGYKAGILNVGGASQVPVKPESIDAFEVGYKYEDRRFSADVASYYYNYKNLQVSSFQAGQAQIRNAAQSRIWGAEGSARYRLTDEFNINLGAAYTHARYTSFKNAPYYTYCNPAVPAFSGQPFDCGAIGPGSLTQVTTDASGYHMQRSPDFTANLGASYHTPLARGDLTLSGNLYYTSKFYFDPSQQFVQNSYTVLGLRAQWVDPSDHYAVALYGNNVTDKRYRTQVLFNTLGIGNTWSAPATWGLEVGVRL
ncbi:MAG TPA: TonB-dependent receptor [Steroidobacteraceae bacterium]|nr:TonB-dependent receptor [Steroidobacteraceae bacterium]